MAYDADGGRVLAGVNTRLKGVSIEEYSENGYQNAHGAEVTAVHVDELGTVYWAANRNVWKAEGGREKIEHVLEVPEEYGSVRSLVAIQGILHVIARRAALVRGVDGGVRAIRMDVETELVGGDFPEIGIGWLVGRGTPQRGFRTEVYRVVGEQAVLVKELEDEVVLVAESRCNDVLLLTREKAMLMSGGDLTIQEVDQLLPVDAWLGAGGAYAVGSTIYRAMNGEWGRDSRIPSALSGYIGQLQLGAIDGIDSHNVWAAGMDGNVVQLVEGQWEHVRVVNYFGDWRVIENEWTVSDMSVGRAADGGAIIAVAMESESLLIGRSAGLFPQREDEGCGMYHDYYLPRAVK